MPSGIYSCADGPGPNLTLSDLEDDVDQFAPIHHL